MRRLPVTPLITATSRNDRIAEQTVAGDLRHPRSWLAVHSSVAGADVHRQHFASVADDA